MKAIKSPVSCSFWPHCGACNNNTILQQKPLTSTSSNRQNSLKNPRARKTFHDNDVCGVTSGKNERASLLRRNHSDKHLVARNGNDGNGKINGGTAAANVSTVSVNVNVIKLDIDGHDNGNTGIVEKSCPRNKTQWTLLCSGVRPTLGVPKISARTAAHSSRSDSFNASLTVAADANKLTPRPRVTPLTATSLVFLGDCEMPITRDHKARQRLQHATSADAGRSRMNVIRHESAERTSDDWYSRNVTTTTASNFFDSDNKRKISITTTRKDKTTKEASPVTIYECLRNKRSLSLPNIFAQLTTTTLGLPKTTTANDGVNIIGIKNGFSGNLSNQIRAVSSPSLTDALQQETTNASAATTTIQLTSTSAATSSVSDESPTPPVNCYGGRGGGGSSSNNSTNIPTSQSVGVLQKFKRTLTSFNKNQHQYAPNAVTTNGNNSHMYAHGSNGASSTSALSVAAAAAATPVEMPQHHDVTDSVSGKYRFGPLIWRSSKERRKTKYNRRDKCNSGDSGIQIELENDEQFTRISGNGAANTLASTGLTVARNTDDKASPKLRSVRRTNSAKATTIFDQTTAAMSAKAKILKRMENFGERAAPASLPTRSLSQPNGLETFGIGRTGDLDDSDDSDSVASHDEGPNYYSIYAEVLYNFTAAGPQELGLERGTLIEILRKEVGPWWFGRIRKEDTTLVEEILDPELGWFPKEFVRVIQCPEMDTFFLAHMSQMQSSTLIPTTVLSMEQTLATSIVAPPPTTIPPSLSSGAVVEAATTTTAVANTMQPSVAINAEIDADADGDADATVVDQNNVTTIVIESPTTYNNSTMNANSSSECTLVLSRSTNILMDSADVLRRSAVKELLDTEMNYVKLLASICEGYLPAMSKRIDIFSPNSIRLIFSNILAIYKFQRKFLEALRKGIEQNQIAKIFLKMHKGFLCYSTYCNAYPRALIELESYDRVKDAKTILDNCRESENLAELPLSAHLLAPVQRICRYPLHLAEIIKNAAKSGEFSASTLSPSPTSQDLQLLEQKDVSQLDIPDSRGAIDMALEAMKSITEAVNEGKRHSETIARHQSSFQNFKDPPLHLHSTRFFLQIDATRQKQNLWNSSCTLFLFDNQLIYCKRDIIKRSQFIYKGRIFLDRCRVVNVRDGKMFGHTIKNSLRLYCEARDKWFDFSFRSANRKHRFLNTLALERQFGGKALYVSEMAGFEYAFEERDFSDQSDYEMPDSEIGVGGTSGQSSLRLREHIYDMAGGSSNNYGTSAATSGENSVPESPVKYKFNADTLPKKSQSRDAISGSGSGVANGSTNSGGNECQTGSLGRRRLGNWFRKPKSSNSTPNHSPTHKPLELQMMPTETSLPNLTLVERGQDTSSSSAS